MTGFSFTSAQADAIRAPLRARFAGGAIRDFIQWAEYTITAWQAAWPAADPARGKAELARLKKLGAAATELYYQMNTLDRAWLRPVLENMRWPPDDELGQKRERLQLLIDDLRKSVQTEIDDYSEEYGFNGRSNARKADLVERLAWDYCRALDDKPTTSPGSPFMESVRAIGEALSVTIGKDTVAAAVRRWRVAHRIINNPADL